MKKGISLVSLIVVIIIMVILAGIVVVTGMDSFQTAELNTFAVEILNIQSAVDEYRFRHEKYPVGEDKILNMSEIQNEFKNQFENEIITDEKIAFKMVDLTLIGINDTEYGNNNYYNDVYVLSEATGRVYYLAGLKYEEQVYYTLTDRLYDISNISSNIQLTSRDIKVYDVIFTPSSKDITNQPITVLLKVPKQATIDSITTTNFKSVSEETVVGIYKQVEINATSQDKTGNYKIIVNYTYNNTKKTVEYEVTNYDAAVPNVTFTEEIKGDLKTVTVTINDNGSKIKTVKYEKEIVADNSYFKNYGKIISNNQFVVNKDDYFTIYVETTSGVIVTANNMLDEWKANVIDIVDGVPIPKGFVASSATGENKKDSGLVIYEGTEPVTKDNVDTARRTRNQYVWVPVEDFSKFVRQSFDGTKTISNTLGINLWEVELDLTTNIPHTTQPVSYMTSTTLAEVQEMYESVKKYKGFYIARYEMGLELGNHKISNDRTIETTVYSKMNKAPYNYVSWTYDDVFDEDIGGAVEVARGIYPKANTNYGVVSTLTYGVQWDRTLAWWLEVGAKTGINEVITSVTNSTSYGNYSDNEILLDTFNEGAQYLLYSNDSLTTTYTKVTTTKAKNSTWLLTTGATEETKVNNIYDMAGNLIEYTMEGMYTTYADGTIGEYRVARGGCSFSDTSISVSYRDGNVPGSLNYTNFNAGFRTCLYIK